MPCLIELADTEVASLAEACDALYLVQSRHPRALPAIRIDEPTIAMMWPPKEVSSASCDAWTLMLRVNRPTSPRSSTSKVILPKCM